LGCGRGLRATGPLTIGFWDKVHNKKSESLEASGTSLGALEELTGIFQREFREGEQLALYASIVAEPPKNERLKSSPPA
jgi:hypothetical protein